jgi:UDP-N-acetylmuramoyl-L-alanyl-D-glutamate--2,6-diaminopimelate ligase
MRLDAEAIWGVPVLDSILVSNRMTLRELLDGLEVVQLTPATTDPNALWISSLEYDSRRAGDRCAFFALPGVKTDGNRFVGQAVGQGAVAVVSEAPRPADLAETVAWVQVPLARRALALAGANFYGRPADALEMVGVTGTNGKTTTTFLVDSILRAAGRRTGLFGTVLYRTPKRAALAANTTPESLELTRLLAELRAEGGTSAVLEVSSHALAMDRVWGCRFTAAVFTNFTRDHLDYHQTMENYFAAKRRLFEGTGAGAPAVGIVNLDDPYGCELVGLAARTLTYGFAAKADVSTSDYRLSPAGLEFTLRTPAGPIELRSRLTGRVNVSNILAAAATALGLGIEPEAIVRGIARVENVPGRFERVDAGQPFPVVVDYAHTDDALARLAETARELNLPGRILLLFGAGGDRDRAKRPLMGEAAGRGADLVVVTSDNPRSEDPQAIVNDILPGVERTGAKFLVELDRGRAIEKILAAAGPGDIVLIAGKGHEAYQILGDRTIPFDDRQMARQALRALGYKGARAADQIGAAE